MPVQTLKILGPAFCLLLFALCFSSLPACKKPTEPPPIAMPDTTSHDFVFEIDTLGADAFGYPSHLKDVAIVDENNVWGVGQIFLENDSGQVDPILYNAAHWDGKKWNLVKVPVRDFGGLTSSFPLESAFGFSASNVWVASSAGLIRWNGSFWSEKAFFMNDLSFNGQVSKMWGTSGSNIYCVGRNGAIYHYNGSTWQKLDSGTDIDLVDIWGTSDDNIWIAGLDLTTGQRSVLLHYDGVSMRKAYEYVPPYPGLKPDRLTGIVNSVWTSSKEQIWVVDAGVFKCPANTMGEGTLSWRPLYVIGFLERLRGNAPNNIFVIGHFGTMAHYNGSGWRHYFELSNFQTGPRLRAVAVSEQSVFAVGSVPGQAVVVRGTRQ